MKKMMYNYIVWLDQYRYTNFGEWAYRFCAKRLKMNASNKTWDLRNQHLLQKEMAAEAEWQKGFDI